MRLIVQRTAPALRWLLVAAAFVAAAAAASCGTAYSNAPADSGADIDATNRVDATASDPTDATADAGADASQAADTGGAVAIAVSTSAFHSCALTNNGGVFCWGYDGTGDLGNGAANAGPTPLSAVLGLASGVSAIATGNHHSCALLADGSVQCWGRNGSGELGADAATTLSVVPVRVTLPGPATAIAAGYFNTCVLIAGDVYCWGDNTYAQCGFAPQDSGVPDSGVVGGGAPFNATPTKVLGLPAGKIVAISVNGETGAAHACALTSTGAMYCWGDRTFEELGDGELQPEAGSAATATPSLVFGLDAGVASISTGSLHTCAIANGSLMCWGSNAYGQLGDSTLQPRATPVSVQGVSTPLAVGAGNVSTCALVDGGVSCWGSNAYGELGFGTLVGPYEVATAIVGLDGGAENISNGFATPCSVTTTGGIRCWGRDDFGQVGNGQVISAGDGGGVTVPTAVIGFSR